MRKMVVFTDLDGTLLDASSYSYEAAMPALRALREKEIPLVICSSKTRKEIEYYRKLLDNPHPFITENGGGIFIPAGYFPRGPDNSGMARTREGIYEVIRLGTGYERLREAVRQLRSEGFEVTGFGDMTVGQLADATGLPVEQAEMAKERDFDEPFLFSGPENKVAELEEAISKMGLSATRGRFFHILGGSDKGKAVAMLSGLYRDKYGDIITVALGDGRNDAPMLELVDYPVLVGKPDGTHDPGIKAQNLRLADGIGPEGWNRVLTDILREMPGGL